MDNSTITSREGASCILYEYSGWHAHPDLHGRRNGCDPTTTTPTTTCRLWRAWDVGSGATLQAGLCSGFGRAEAGRALAVVRGKRTGCCRLAPDH